ncbi:MAG: DUF4445 domain-containing protein [Lachnospiraceae bacterium]|nr:DUF4445 domain-containing protein [Lachnospiraceae bacterium]
MTGNETSLSKGGHPNSGRRCQICTGCGLCPGVLRQETEGLRILTRQMLGEHGKGLRNVDGLRLVAADVGTTTIAMELYDENGTVQDRFVCVNPQTEFGADVLSRIRAAQDPQKKEKMFQMIRSAFARGAERFLKWLREGEQMVCVIAANTVMSYLMMDWDPKELGQAPFHASRLTGARFAIEGSDGKGMQCLLLPGFSAFVGSDLLAGAYASGMTESRQMTLLLDLGTNGEILLGNKEEILATATAAGPAFEGGVNRGIWGADLVKLMARLLEEGAADETGLLKDPYFERGIRIGNVMLTQEAIRSLQLAKAAIEAGIRILVEQKGITLHEIDRVILAGGFGYFLNPGDAVQIGLLPSELETRAIAGGNTALAGAKQIGAGILNRAFWERESLWTHECPVRVINLAEQAHFPEYYMEAMNFRMA